MAVASIDIGMAGSVAGLGPRVVASMLLETREVSLVNGHDEYAHDR